MSDACELGVLYTDHSGLTAMSPLASLWSYETRARGHNGRSIVLNPDGSQEYWLDRSDPLLNTILPGTHVSLIINFGDMWATGPSLPTSALVPRVCVMGPFTQARILRMGISVHAVGAVVPPTLTPDVFGVPATELVDRIVPLLDLWSHEDVERLFVSLSGVDRRRGVSALKNAVLARFGRPSGRETVGQAALGLIRHQGGHVSIEEMARHYGLGRQQFARRFCSAAGLPPKLFARITRFQRLVHVLLSTDVSRWASVPPALGFYDQAHMINEFRGFAGSPPTVFFRPHDSTIDPARIQLRGRPSEWLRRPEPAARTISPADTVSAKIVECELLQAPDRPSS